MHFRLKATSTDSLTKKCACKGAILGGRPWIPAGVPPCRRRGFPSESHDAAHPGPRGWLPGSGDVPGRRMRRFLPREVFLKEPMSWLGGWQFYRMSWLVWKWILHLCQSNSHTPKSFVEVLSYLNWHRWLWKAKNRLTCEAIRKHGLFAPLDLALFSRGLAIFFCKIFDVNVETVHVFLIST